MEYNHTHSKANLLIQILKVAWNKLSSFLSNISYFHLLVMKMFIDLPFSSVDLLL